MAEVTSGNMTALLLTPDEIKAVCEVLEDYSMQGRDCPGPSYDACRANVRQLRELYDALGLVDYTEEMEV
jgi:hypothetical protein